MRTLIDTNVFIYREDHRILPEKLARLVRALNSNRMEVLVHPQSIRELQSDPATG